MYFAASSMRWLIVSLMKSLVTTETVCGMSAMFIATRVPDSACFETYGLAGCSLMVKVGRATVSLSTGVAGAVWAEAACAPKAKQAHAISAGYRFMILTGGVEV